MNKKIEVKNLALTAAAILTNYSLYGVLVSATTKSGGRVTFETLAYVAAAGLCFLGGPIIARKIDAVKNKQ